MRIRKGSTKTHDAHGMCSKLSYDFGVNVTASTPPSLNEQNIIYAAEVIQKTFASFATKIIGQRRLLESLIIAVFGNGHILLESVPGLAKTTAARTVADTFAGEFQRIQCTPDLLPADIVGSQILDPQTRTFRTILGPVHANILLLDEINRATPKTQSAMLEAMEEKQTSIAGEVHPLPHPFIVLATQNPIDQEGTYPLPEAQMDRFMIKDVIEYPTVEEEVKILGQLDPTDPRFVGATKSATKPLASIEDLLRVQQIANYVFVSPAIKWYIASIVNHTRHPELVLPADKAHLITLGSGPRGSLALVKAARIVALSQGRAHILPEDISIIAPRVLNHRISLSYEALAHGYTTTAMIEEIVRLTPQVAQ